MQYYSLKMVYLCEKATIRSGTPYFNKKSGLENLLSWRGHLLQMEKAIIKKSNKTSL